MTLVEIAPYLTIATLAICAVMSIAFWLVRQSDDKAMYDRTVRRIDAHLLEIVRILAALHDRADGADESRQRAKAASAYFERNVHRLESLRVRVEGLLPTIEDRGSVLYPRAVRRILEVEAWLIERYYIPHIPAEARCGLWTAKTINVVEQTESAMTAARSLGIAGFEPRRRASGES